MENRFYCTVKKGQVTVESNTTIPSTDEKVANFFKPTPEGYRKAYDDNGLPFNELIPLPTDKEIEDKRIADIECKADEIIEAICSPKKQRKLSSIAISLLDKKIDSMITDDEETLLQSCRDVNTWISSIRTIENIAIEDGTLPVDVVWS